MAFVETELAGQLLLTMPNTLHKELSRVAMVVTQNWASGSECIVVNRPLRHVTVSQIMINAGIEYNGNELVYWGGGMDVQRIQVLHTLDWTSHSTRHVNNLLGLTNDVSVLAAIAGGQGPELWRCISGHLLMGPKELEQQLHAIEPWADPRWGYLKTNATPELVLQGGTDEQWLDGIAAAGRETVDTWF